MEPTVNEATVAQAGAADRSVALTAEELVRWREPRVGRYVLVEPIGKGSFGSVWAAFDPELDRKVAIKLVHMRRGSVGGSTRDETNVSMTGGDELVSEAQLLAQLSHPNVVAIHDVGWLDPDHVAAGGARALYVVMEHLGGSTLAAYLADGSASVREILATMLEAGRGLEAAHARGLIHLDFKPGNVMFGDDGRVRVLDFGLARVSRRSGVSESGSRPVAGTPSYMAPEQHLGEEPDARADQFAFAVTLWEALWGERPYARTEAQTDAQTESMAELRERKLAGPPTPPRKRKVPAHVRAAVVRALAPRPEDRFASMTELLAALAADPGERRRRWLLGGALGLGVAAALFGASPRADPCALPDDRFVGVWDREVDAALTAAFERAAPDIAEALMTRVRAGLDDQIARWTEVRAQVCEAGQAASGRPREAMGEEFLCLEAHLQRVAALTRSLAAADRESVARAADSVAQLAAPEACLQVRQGRARRELDEPTRAEILEVRELLAEAEAELALARYEDALARADEALARADGLADPVVLAELRRVRGSILMRLARFEEARASLLAALADAERSGDERSTIAVSLALVESETKATRYGEAELLAQISEARLDGGRIEDPRLRVGFDAASSEFLLGQNRYDEARARAEQGLARLRELGPDEELGAAAFHLTLGNIEAASHGDLDAGTERYEAALAIWIRAYGPGHPQIGTVYMNLGAIDFRRADFEAALVHLEAAAEVFGHVYPPDHPRHAMVDQNLGAIRMTLGDYAGAVAPNERALQNFAASVGRASPQYAVAEGNLAALYSYLGRCREALPLCDHAIAVFEAEANNARALIPYGTKIECLWQLGRAGEAGEAVERVAALMQTVDPGEPRRLAGHYVIGDAALRAGEAEAALAQAEALAAMIDEGRLTEPEPVADGARLLGRSLRALGRLAEARERLTTILDARLGGAGEGAHLASWRVRIELGHVERAAGDPDAARRHYEAAWGLLDGYARSPIYGADVSLVLAELELDGDPARARARAREALAILADADPSPELRARAAAILGEDEG